jgi:uncharacterized zinc-type alcohol dehydrogenase-like protein
MEITAMAAMERGAELSQWQFQPGPLGPFECLVRVQTCGLCYSDVHMIDNDWAMSRYPLVPGHEVVGTVVELGEMATHLAIGDRVGVGWQRAACMQCPDCLRGQENLCSQTEALIGEGYGGFADHVVADSRFVFRLPDGLTTQLAGPLLCGGATVYTALRHAGMSSGQDIGIIGVGGLGHLAVQFAAKLGNRVTVFTSSADKAELAAQLGAHEAVLTARDEPLPTPKRPFEILLNTAPASLDWAAYVEQLDSNGTLAFVAAPEAPLTLPAFSLMLKQRRIVGSVIGSRSTITEMLRIADTFGVAPIVETFPLDEVNTAIAKLRDGSVRYRAVLTVP